VITRIWIGTTNSLAENTLEQLQELLDTVSRNTKTSLSAPATHAALNLAQLLWKRVESASTQEQFGVAEAWCRVCLHPVFDKSGAQNKAKIARLVLGGVRGSGTDVQQKDNSMRIITTRLCSYTRSIQPDVRQRQRRTSHTVLDV
jgi:hypothetical protein